MSERTSITALISATHYGAEIEFLVLADVKSCVRRTPFVSRLQRVYKLWILHVRQVQELLVLQVRVSRLSAYLCIPLVTPSTQVVDEEEVEDAKTPTHNDGDFGRLVVGSAERLRSWTFRQQLRCHMATTIYLPMMFPAQYPIKYIAATVVFFVYPAILLETKLSRHTKPIALH